MHIIINIYVYLYARKNFPTKGVHLTTLRRCGSALANGHGIVSSCKVIFPTYPLVISWKFELCLGLSTVSCTSIVILFFPVCCSLLCAFIFIVLLYGYLSWARIYWKQPFYFIWVVVWTAYILPSPDPTLWGSGNTLVMLLLLFFRMICYAFTSVYSFVGLFFLESTVISI